MSISSNFKPLSFLELTGLSQDQYSKLTQREIIDLLRNGYKNLFTYKEDPVVENTTGGKLVMF